MTSNGAYESALEGRRFRKMHGLGNDFVVLDARAEPLTLSAAQIAGLANRRTGIGCDQLIVIEPGDAEAEAFMRIYNSDASQVSACGNATRCVARLLMEETGASEATIRTRAGLLRTRRAADGGITADMGPALLEWTQIPLAVPCDTLHAPYSLEPLVDPVCVSMGNPHVVFFVPDVAAIDLETLGPAIETDSFFPEKTNVEIVQQLGPDTLRMRVWERGVGITQACGTGACATLVAAARRGLTGRTGKVVLDGGVLEIEWAENGHVLMTGAATLVGEGTLHELETEKPA